MQYRILGDTNLKVSLLSLGSGGPSKLGQHEKLVQKQQSFLVHRALDLGINLLDTAADYGDSETILGRALKAVPRDSYHLTTKWEPKIKGSLKEDPQLLIDSMERSLQRLRTDHVEVMFFHSLRAIDYGIVVDRFYPTMEKLREQGKIRFIGLSTSYKADPQQTAASVALKMNPKLWDVIMLKYGILNQLAAKEMLPLALDHDIGIMNMAAVRIKLPDQKLLDGLIAKWKEAGHISNNSISSNDPLGWLVHDDVDSVISAGYKFAAEHPAVSTVLTGTANVSHLESNVAALEKPSLLATDTQRLKNLFGDIVEYA